MKQVIFNVDEELLELIDNEVETRKETQHGYTRTIFILEAIQKELKLNPKEKKFIKGNRTVRYTIEDLCQELEEGVSYSIRELEEKTGMSRGTVKNLLIKYDGSHFKEVEAPSGNQKMFLFLNPDNVVTEKPAKKKSKRRGKKKVKKMFWQYPKEERDRYYEKMNPIAAAKAEEEDRIPGMPDSLEDFDTREDYIVELAKYYFENREECLGMLNDALKFAKMEPATMEELEKYVEG